SRCYSSSDPFRFRSEFTDDLNFFARRKFISVPGHDWRDFKIFSWRRRLRAPLESRQMPRIRLRVFAVAHRPDEVNRRYQHAEAENRRARGREHVEDLKLRRVGV